MRALALALGLAACKTSEPPKAEPAPRAADAYVPGTSLIPDPPDAGPPLLDARAPLTVATTTPCLQPEIDGTVTVDTHTVTYCQDDRVCAVWDRKTKQVRIEHRFEVESDPSAAVEQAPPPKPETSKISFPDDRVELCPRDRACFQFRPEQTAEVGVQWALLDHDETLAAVTLYAEGGRSGRVELWSVATGRRKVSIPVRDLDPDYTYEIRTEFVPGGLIIYAIDNEGDAMAKLYGLDGRLRAALGKDSDLLEYDEVFMLDDRRLVAFDDGEAHKPYVFYLHDVRTGAVLSKVEIPQIVDDNWWVVDRFGEAIVVTEQWSASKLRIDVIDPRPKKIVHAVFTAPGC